MWHLGGSGVNHEGCFMKLNKMGLFGKIFSGYVLAVAVIAILSSIIVINAEHFEASADSVKTDILPHTLDAKNLQIHVINKIQVHL